MADQFHTSTPKKLLAAFKKAIDDGHVKTWSYDSSGDFTHTPEQWRYKAWMRPSIVEGQTLVFNIVSSKSVDMTYAIYGVYHGRLIESLIEHCNTLFSSAEATPNSVSGDII